jgi:hypothetical protein
MPALCFDRRQLHRSAWATLVAWLLALAVGVVNACALAPAGSMARAVSAGDFAVHGPEAAAPSDAGHESHHHHGHEQDAGKHSCLKFCDDGSSALAKIKLPLADFGPGLLTMGQPWDTVSAPDGGGAMPALERPGAQGPPLVIRFLRLTL